MARSERPPISSAEEGILRREMEEVTQQDKHFTEELASCTPVRMNLSSSCLVSKQDLPYKSFVHQCLHVFSEEKFTFKRA